MFEFLKQYGGNVHSQNGEDLAIAEALRRLGITISTCVEFGGNDGLWLSNTRLLIENGWYGKFIEGDYSLYERCRDNWKHNPRVSCQCSMVDGQNVNAFVDDTCDVLSIDCDGPDFEIFKGLKAKPKIVIIEVDSSIPPTEYAFNADGASGYRPMVELALSKNYFVLCHTGNLILAATEYRGLFPEIEGDGLTNSELYFNRSWLKEAA